MILQRSPQYPLAGSKPAPGAQPTEPESAVTFWLQPGPGYGMRVMAVLAFTFLLVAGLHAQDPFISTGYLKFPAEVELGAFSAVEVDAADQIYVLHRGEPPIVAFDAAGNYLRAFGQGLFKVPHGLRIDREGHLWTTDNGNHVLRKFTPAGRLVATYGTEGKPAAGPQGFRAPDDLVFDSQGNIYVADSGNGRIVKLNSEGGYLADWGKKGKEVGQFATAHGLAIDQSNRIYVADRGNKRVQVFDATGKPLAQWSGFGNPFGLLVVGGELLATEGDIHKVFHLDLTSGQITKSWGDPQSLLLPHFMAVNSKGLLFVCEVNGQRVQIFKPAAAPAP
jgi:outer membrane protein assembly factor BamB